MSQFRADSIGRLISERQLKRVERELGAFDHDSAYWAALSGDFARAEDAEIDDMAQRARGAVTARACDKLRLEVASATDVTGRVYASLSMLRCRGDGRPLVEGPRKDQPTSPRGQGLIDI